MVAVRRFRNPSLKLQKTTARCRSARLACAAFDIGAARSGLAYVGRRRTAVPPRAAWVPRRGVQGEGARRGAQNVKARVASFSQAAFEVEVQVSPILKARIEVTVAESNIDIASLAVGAMTESIVSSLASKVRSYRKLYETSDNCPWMYRPRRRHLHSHLSRAVERRTHTHQARPTRPASAHATVWSAYTGVTETMARLILSAAQFQTQ